MGRISSAKAGSSPGIQEKITQDTGRNVFCNSSKKTKIFLADRGVQRKKEKKKEN